MLFRNSVYWCVLLGLAISTLSGCVGDVSSKSLPAFTQEAPTPVDPHLQAFLDDYRRFFSNAMVSTQAPGAAVVIVKGDSIIFQQGFGVKIAGKKDSVDIHTVFRIGSLSKGFAGVLTGVLVQQGLLTWEENVQDCFPEFTLRDRQQAKRIKLWHLLSHTTGLPYHAFTNLVERGFDTRKIVVEYFPKAPVCGKEGAFYSYQNAAFCVIEEVMKATTDKGYPQLLAETIFQPAGMSFASCDFQTMQSSNNKALPHFWTGSQWRSDTISPLYYNSAAAGGVNASISDMGAWLKLLLGHQPQIVADSTLDKVFTPIIKTGNERRIFPHWINRDAAAYALGWRVLQHNSDTIMYHGGYVNGFRSEIAFNRRDNIGICVLFNASSDLSSTCIQTFFDRWDIAKSQIR
jgi:beta-lactamase class C